MKNNRLFAVLLLFCCTGYLTHCLLAKPLVVLNFPSPPQQQAAWNPQTNTVSPELVSATETLFNQGLADPRGCNYKEIEVQVGNLWPRNNNIVKTHGWVLPNSSDHGQVYAICWNGLIYPVVSTGGPADLQADSKILTGGPANQQAGSKMFSASDYDVLSESASVNYGSMLPIKACLLLRLGENDLASRVWKAYDTSHPRQSSKDPYLVLASDWAWSLFDRMICAHMRGDVPLALVSARELADIQPKIEAESARRGFPHPQDFSQRTPTDQPYLSFLNQLPQLLSDLERRAREPKDKSIIEIGLTNFPDQSRRIAALIDDLDMVNAVQMSQPGGVYLPGDPIVRALINEDAAAVDPLINCMENDKRLTRSVGFWRDFFRERHVIPVASAAHVALEEILHIQFQNGAEVESYWKKNRGLKLEDRWYATLQDDQAGINAWLQAAQDIMQPDNVLGVPGGLFYSSRPLNIGEKPKYRGEILRSKSNPSVAELLIERANDIAADASQEDQSQAIEKIRSGTQLVEMLSQWDKPADAIIPAQSLMRRAIVLWPNWTTFIGSDGHDLAIFIPKLTDIRAEGGDTNALSEYAAWIKITEQEKVDENAIDAFEPLCRFSNDLTIIDTSEWLFNNTNSTWSKLPWERNTFHDPLDSDLVKLPAFRKLLARELENQTVAGSMQWHGYNGTYITYDIAPSRGSFQFTWPGTNSPPDGTSAEVRRCDWVAWSLSKSHQIPFFNPFVPIDERNTAIAKDRTILLTPK